MARPPSSPAQSEPPPVRVNRFGLLLQGGKYSCAPMSGLPILVAPVISVVGASVTIPALIQGLSACIPSRLALGYSVPKKLPVEPAPKG
jgi:hypothetical protein